MRVTGLGNRSDGQLVEVVSTKLKGGEQEENVQEENVQEENAWIVRALVPPSITYPEFWEMPSKQLKHIRPKK